MDYKQKYLKYKSKYLDLKEQIGGDWKEDQEKKDKIKKLRRAGFHQRDIDEMSVKQITKMITLKEEGFSPKISYEYSKTALEAPTIRSIIKGQEVRKKEREDEQRLNKMKKEQEQILEQIKKEEEEQRLKKIKEQKEQIQEQIKEKEQRQEQIKKEKEAV